VGAWEREHEGGLLGLVDRTSVLGAVQAGAVLAVLRRARPALISLASDRRRPVAGLRAAARGCARCSLREQPGQLLRAEGWGSVPARGAWAAQGVS
jgi:hypothetical protein